MSRAATTADSHGPAGACAVFAGERRSSGASLDSGAFSRVSGGGGGSSGDEAALPRSVRGAAPELRREIRKRQNSESAKRCRQRKKLETARTAEEMQIQARTVRRLEAAVATLAARLQHAQAALRAIAGPAAAAAPPCPHGALPAACPTCAAWAPGFSPRFPLHGVQPQPLPPQPLPSQPLPAQPVQSQPMQSQPMQSQPHASQSLPAQPFAMPFIPQVDDVAAFADAVDSFEGSVM